MTAPGAPARARLAVSVGPVALANPVLVASGTFGHGLEAAPFIDLSRLGGIVSKSVGLTPWPGNPPPRVFETAAGLLNSIGLQNPGIEAYLAQTLPGLVALGTAIIPNIVGRSVEEFEILAERLGAVPGIAAFEANLSCPNTREGGVLFSHDEDLLSRTVRALKAKARQPLWVKLSPNVTDIGRVAAIARDAGADALTVANTFIGLAVDWRRRAPRLGGGTGGLSGPAVKPLALRAVHACYRATRGEIPILGVGGIACAEDALEFICAGATAVQVGTATFRDVTTPIRIVDDLPPLLESAGIRDLASLRGTLAMP